MSAPTKSKTVGGAKNGQTRLVPDAANRAPKWYPADDIKQPKKSRKTPRPTKLRASLTPGTVCIVLAGRFRGKRVVMLKQINDTILVTGPFKINGVPLRRINPAYVIATSTKVELPSGLSLDKFDEAYFKVKKEKKGKSAEQEFFGEGEKVELLSVPADLQKKTIPEGRASDQKEVDKAIIQTITKTPHMRAYLASSFSLSKGDKPHLLKF